MSASADKSATHDKNRNTGLHRNGTKFGTFVVEALYESSSPMIARRFPSFALVTALLASLMTFTAPAPVASAAAPHQSLVPVTPRTDVPRILDGSVFDVAQVGNKVIVAGDFTSVQPSGQQPVAQSYLMAYDIDTGQFDASFRPAIDRPVNIIEPAADGQSIYIGGLFAKIDGVTRRKVARVDLNGSLVAGFRANASAEVTALALDADANTLYVGGNFAKIGGRVRARLAAVDAASGSVNPNFDFPLSGPVGAGGFMGVKALDVTNDGDQLLVLHSSRFIGGQPRTAVALFDVSGSVAALRDWSTTLYEDALPAIGGQLRISDAAFSPDGSYFVVVSSGGDRPPTNDSAVKFSTAGGPGVSQDWISRHFDSVYSVDISETAIYVGGHFQYQEAPGSTNPFPGDPTVNYGFGQGLGPAVLGDEVVRREQVGALNPTTGKSLNWSPGANGFHGVTAVRVVDRGLLIGHDGTLIGGADIGRHGFFDLETDQNVAGEPETFLSSPRDAEILDTVESVELAGVATAGNGVSAVQVTVQNLQTKLWLRPDGSFAAGWGTIPIGLDDPGAQSTNWSRVVDLPVGTYRVRAKTIDGAGRKDPSSATAKFEVNEAAQLPPETSFAAPSTVVGNVISSTGYASDDSGIAEVRVSYFDMDHMLWLQADGTLSEQFSATSATLSAPNALETTWTISQSVPDGNWRIVVKAVDLDGVQDPSTARDRVSVFPDNELPALELLSPENGLVATPGSLTISGTASDDFGVKRVWVLVSDIVTRQGPQPNGFFGKAVWISVPVADRGATSTSWSVTIDDLPIGNYRIIAYATDMNDQKTDAAERPRVYVDLGVAGDARPDTRIVSPTNYQQDFENTSVSITGTATDDLGVAGVDVAVYDVNSRKWLQGDGQFNSFEMLGTIVDSPGATAVTFSLELDLPIGTYRVYTYALDTSGQYDASAARAVSNILVYPGDAEPTIELNSPIAGDQFAGGVISASGRAFDDVGVERVEVLIRARTQWFGPRRDGTMGAPQWVEAFASNPGGVFTDWSYSSIELPAGEWYVRARTVDSVGKTTTDYPQVLVTVP